MVAGMISPRLRTPHRARRASACAVGQNINADITSAHNARGFKNRALRHKRANKRALNARIRLASACALSNARARALLRSLLAASLPRNAACAAPQTVAAGIAWRNLARNVRKKKKKT